MPKRSKGPTLEENTRIKIAKYLPEAIDHAIQSYRDISKAETTEAVKKVSAHHSACKAAIAHIELLLKLAAWAQLPRDDEDTDLIALMINAQAELDKHKEEEGCDE